MPNLLLSEMVNAGVLEFGQFKVEGQTLPFRFSAEYLPAYPNLLSKLARQADVHFKTLHPDRLVAPEESLPFGIACAIQSGISLAYTKTGGAFPVQNLVGAYDSGHKVALLLNEFDNRRSHNLFITDARRVGLEITAIATILAINEVETGDIPVLPLFQLSNLIGELTEAGYLSVHQAEAVRRWAAEPLSRV
ncbi:MAG: hypothetical protein LCI00_03380 [Chloroflexi bacterium]|nr:hypothetical protein [Chloroflexota bacterium]MCC6891333.1 hypothetical protein [Anaerolineae bacterium]